MNQLFFIQDLFHELKSRIEESGAIIFIPRYNCHFYVNNDTYKIIQVILKFINVKNESEFLIDISKELNFSNLQKTKIIVNKIINQFHSELAKFKNIKISQTKMEIPMNLKLYEYKNQLKSPLRVLLEITDKCNYDCSFCYVHNDKNKKPCLKYKEIINIINQAFESEVFLIHLTGGEPLFNPKLYEILKNIESKNILCSITTNGWFIDKQIKALKLIKAIPIEVSLHNVDEESYKQYISVPNAYQKVISNLKLLKENQIRFGIKMVISKINYLKNYEMAKLASNLYAESLTLITLTPTGKGKKLLNLALFSLIEIKEIFKQINKAKKDFPNLYLNYSMLLNIYFPLYNSVKSSYSNFCTSAIVDLRIRYDGKVIQCSANRNTFFGDIRKKSLNEIWKSSLICKTNCSLLNFSTYALNYALNGENK